MKRKEVALREKIDNELENKKELDKIY